MNKLEQLIVSFSEKKSMLDKLDKESKELNTEIKNQFSEQGIDTYEFSGYSAHTISVDNSKLNEPQLINSLKKLVEDGKISRQKYNKIVKTREYIDNEALEDAIYNSFVSNDVVSSCVEHKAPTIKLFVKRA